MKRPSSRRPLLFALLTIGAVFIGSGARADTVIFDNLSPNNNGFFGVSPTTWDAQRFNSDSINLLLTSATLNLFSSGGSGTFFLKLYSDQLVGATPQPGSSLATLFDGTDRGGGNVLFASLSASLAPNTNYWLVLGEDAGATLGLGWAVTIAQTGTGSGFQVVEARTSNSGATWAGDGNAPQIMQLTASAVPEPSITLYFFIGVTALLAATWHRFSQRSRRAEQKGSVS